eukprot:scaffold112302_cov67-Phaeocystis_antarctica.AAC.3
MPPQRAVGCGDAIKNSRDAVNRIVMQRSRSVRRAATWPKPVIFSVPTFHLFSGPQLVARGQYAWSRPSW